MPKLARNSHSLSHYRLATLDMGYLVPVGCIEVLPGDKFYHSNRVLLRVQPLLKPLMHPVSVRLHHWFVPNRIIWPDWDDFITRADPELTIPTIDYESGVDDYTLLDHLGVPDATNTLSALPVRAYNAIYNHAYRDQNIIDVVDEDDLALKRIAWEKDYFTTARADPQFGDAAIDIPFSSGTTAPVIGQGGNVILPTDQADKSYYKRADWARSGITGDYTVPANEEFGIPASGPMSAGGANDVPFQVDADAQAGLLADLSAVAGGGINVNDLRAAMAMQRYLEHRNRYGSRHEDYLRFLGIRPSDGRLQNPEYLGGGKNTIAFSEVLATADSGSAVVGDLSGHGIAALSTRKYRRFFEESGLVISLLSIRPKAMYMTALHKMWQRRTTFDYWQRELEAMGPQAIYTKELYADHGNDTDIFGYNGRHDEYRHHPSYVSGSFRSGGGEVDWHMARDFDTSPALNASFLECLPTDRVYADTATPEIYANVSHNITAIRAVSSRSRH